MTELSAGRYGLAHGDIIASLLLNTEQLHYDIVAGRVMLHVREIERERDEALARANALDAQLTHIIEG